ncbi:MAG: 3-hydroxyacyl-CoA dehydrogenase [Gemmataceae bacterium]
MKIHGNTFLVTGGASGLGGACVRLLAKLGGNAVIADLNEDAGSRLASELGDRVHFVKTDVTNEDDVKHAVGACIKRFGGLHGSIHCAGIGHAERVVGKTGPHSLEAFTKVISINLIGTFNAIRLAGEAISQGEPNEAGERGVIVNTASVAAFDGQIGQAAYSASKGGIVGMTLAIAREFARHGIRVMTIAPGIFNTPLMAGLPEAAKESLGAQVPFPPRLGEPEEFAMLARHIIENPMLNGEVIRLDGALRMAPK